MGGRGLVVGDLGGEVRDLGGAAGSPRASRGPEVNFEGIEAEPHVCSEIAQL